MAKQATPKSGTSRIRFVVLEAEIQDGDLSQITTAIQNALKPATVVQQRIVANPQPSLSMNGHAAEPNDDDLIEVEEETEAPTPKVSRAPRVRKPTTPEVLELDFTSGVSLESFASTHAANSEPERNLVIAAWFKEHRSTAAVTAAHVYTGYRLLKWSAGFEDFSWPLRALKKDKLMSSPARGEYAINHLGIDRVNKLGKAD